MDSVEKLARIEELRAESRVMLEALARDGVGDLGMGGARVELLIEALLPWEDGKNDARLDMELKWEEHANRILAQVAEQVGRAKILHGVSGNQLGLVSPPGSNGHHR